MSDGPQPRAAWPPVAGPTVGKPPAGRRATPVLAGGPVCAGRVRCRPRHAGGAVVVAPAPAAAWLVACTGPCWRRRARVGPASRPRRGGALQSPAAVGGAASRAVSQPHQARHGRQHAPGRSSRARWGHAHSPPVPGAVSAALSHDPAGVAASCGEGGARVGGGGRSLGGEGTRVGSQQPNKGVQATAASVCSSLAPAARRA